MTDPLFRKTDCIRLFVSDLESGLVFYRDKLGHTLIWRSATAAGLRMPGGEAELVLQTTDHGQEVDFTVESIEEAVGRFEGAGGEIVVAPFEIQIGRAAVVSDPWGNRYVLLDTSKGELVTDREGNILGNKPHDQK